MNDNVVWFPGETRLPIPTDRVLAGAAESDLQDVLVIGREKDGTMYVASSGTHIGDLLLMLELAKLSLLEQC